MKVNDVWATLSRRLPSLRTASPRLLAGALDLVFPPSCASCGREGSYLCAACAPTVPRLEQPYCALCAGPTSDQTCSWCTSAPPAYDGVRAPYRFVGAVRQLVHNLKYQNVHASAPELGRLMADHLQSRPLPATLILPVPLHRR